MIGIIENVPALGLETTAAALKVVTMASHTAVVAPAAARRRG
jgi:hypothetical protein